MKMPAVPALSLMMETGIVMFIGVFQPDPVTGRAITINLPSSSGAVRLRGLSINGGGTGKVGVYMDSPGTLEILDCTIEGFKLSATEGSGLYIQPVGGLIKLRVERVAVSGNTLGFVFFPAVGTINGSITGSKISNNLLYGMLIDSGFSASSVVNAIIDSTSIQNNNNGISTFSTNGPDTLFVGRSIISHNSVGIAKFGTGTIYTYGNNEINLNSTDISGSLVAAPTR